MTCAEILRSIIVDVSSLSSGDDDRCGGGGEPGAPPDQLFFANNVSKQGLFVKKVFRKNLFVIKFTQQVVILLCCLTKNFPKFVSINSAKVYGLNSEALLPPTSGRIKLAN